MVDPLVARIRFAPGEMAEALRTVAEWLEGSGPQVVNLVYARPDETSEQIVILYYPAVGDRAGVTWAPPSTLTASAEVMV